MSGIVFKPGRDGSFALGLIRGMSGMVKLGGVRETISRYVRAYLFPDAPLQYVELDEQDWGVLEFGRQTMLFQFVEYKDRLSSGRGMSMDWNLLGTIMLSAVIQLSLIFASFFGWRETPMTKTLNVLMEQMDIKVSKESLHEPALEPMELDHLDVTTKDDKPDDPFGDATQDPDLGETVAKRESDKVKPKNPKSSGLNSVLSKEMKSGGALSGIMSETNSFNNKIAVAVDDVGADYAPGGAPSGFSFKGNSGGKSGLTGYDGIQHVANIDTGVNKTIKVSITPKGKKKVGEFISDPMSSTAGCDKENIYKVVMRRKNLIKFCYDKALMLNPQLSGKLIVKWVIGAGGRVIKADIVVSSMKDKSVQSCVLTRIRSMRFAKPKAGTCVVRWPFRFKPAN